MDLFKQFVVSNRTPTGRTQDSHQRYHGAVFVLPPKMVSLRSKRELSLKRQNAGDSRQIIPSSHATEDESLSGIFNSALKSVCEESNRLFKPVHPSTICRWFESAFPKGSPEYTTLNLHNTDAFAEYAQLTGDISSLNASLKRHSQQEGDMGFD